MSLEECLRYVQQAKEARLSQIGFSGGEPFLFLPVITQVMAAASALGVSASITTNCFWAVSEQQALSLLRPLKKAGLTSLNLSTSQFHLEFIPAGRIVTAARAATQIGLSVRINCIRTESFSAAAYRSLLAGIPESCEFVFIPCIPTGRAHDLVSIQELSRQNRIPQGCCRQHFTKLAVTTEGDVYPCCSPGGFTEPLKLGNLREDDLAMIVDRAQTSSLHQVLDTVGPSFFVAFIKNRLGPLALSQPFVDQCHLCNQIMSNPAMRSIVYAVVEQLDRERKEMNQIDEGAQEIPEIVGAQPGLSQSLLERR
jgi:MoaA/NifB/PqqE/SkfB family radical SAM enzyme